MPDAKPEAVARKYYEKALEGDEKAIDEVLADDFVMYASISEEPIRGADGFKAMLATYRSAAPDMKVKVEDLRVDGDTVRARWSAHFKHTGDFQGRPPSGKEGDIGGSDTLRIVGGKIAEVRNDHLDSVEAEFGFEPKLAKRS